MSEWKIFRKKCRYVLERFACELLAGLMPRLSRSVVVGLANGVGGLVARFDGRGRRVALANLQCVFGNRFSAAEQERLVRRSYQNFALTMISLFWGRRLNEKNFSDWIHIEGFEKVFACLAGERRGVIFMTVHQGNWEWASLAAGFAGMRGTILAGEFKNPALAEIFSTARGRSGHQIIEQEQSMLRLFKRLKRGGHVGMLIDVCAVRAREATVVNAWGLRMALPVLPAMLAQRTGALIVPVVTGPCADGTCRVIAHGILQVPAEASIQQIAQQCWDVFQREIDRQPELWLWAYKHFRHRPRIEGSKYPFYANPSGAFEKLQREAGLESPTPATVVS